MRFESVYIVDYDSVDNMWSFFQGILLACLESFAPFKTVNCNSSRHRLAPWLSSSLLEAIRRKQLSSSLLEAIRRKQRAKRKAELSGDSNDLMDYKQLKNYLKFCTRQARLSYIQQLISEVRKASHLSDQFWAGVNSVLGRHHRKQASIDISLSLDSVNASFRSVAVTDDHQPASTFCQVGVESASSFHFCEVDHSVVLCLLQNLDVRKSVRPDGISAQFLREVAAEVVDLLTILYNKSLKIGVFPDDSRQLSSNFGSSGGGKDTGEGCGPTVEYLF